MNQQSYFINQSDDMDVDTPSGTTSRYTSSGGTSRHAPPSSFYPAHSPTPSTLSLPSTGQPSLIPGSRPVSPASFATISEETIQKATDAMNRSQEGPSWCSRHLLSQRQPFDPNLNKEELLGTHLTAQNSRSVWSRSHAFLNKYYVYKAQSSNPDTLEALSVEERKEYLAEQKKLFDKQWEQWEQTSAPYADRIIDAATEVVTKTISALQRWAASSKSLLAVSDNDLASASLLCGTMTACSAQMKQAGPLLRKSRALLESCDPSDISPAAEKLRNAWSQFTHVEAEARPNRESARAKLGSISQCRRRQGPEGMEDLNQCLQGLSLISDNDEERMVS